MPEKKHGIYIKSYEDYKVFVKDAEHDYFDILKLFLQGRLEAEQLSTANQKHEVWRIYHKGIKYILKIDREKPKHWEGKLWRFLSGPFYSGQMKAVNKAIKNGCNAVPDIYLAAEKRGGFLCKESIIIMEHIAGKQLGEFNDKEQCKERIVNALSELHAHGLALGDCNPSNFLLTEEGFKIIDLSWQGGAHIGKAQDVYSMKRRYGWNLPTGGLIDKMAIAYILAKKTLRSWLRKVRGKE